MKPTNCILLIVLTIVVSISAQNALSAESKPSMPCSLTYRIETRDKIIYETEKAMALQPVSELSCETGVGCYRLKVSGTEVVFSGFVRKYSEADQGSNESREKLSLELEVRDRGNVKMSAFLKDIGHGHKEFQGSVAINRKTNLNYTYWCNTL